MNITPSLIYWITRLDSIVMSAVIALILSLIGSIVLIFGYSVIKYEGGGDEADVLVKPLKHILWVLAISTVTAVFVPSSKEVAAMIVIPRVANSESVKDIGDGIVTLAKEWIEELKPSAKKESK